MTSSRPVIYIIMNKALRMSAGKLASQSAHAAALAVINSPREMVNRWEDAAHKAVIVLSGHDEAYLKTAQEYLEQRKIHTIPIIDEGITEVDPLSWTALTSQILDKDSDDIKAAFSVFHSYRDTVKVTLEVDR